MTTTTIAPPTVDTPAPVRTDQLEIVVTLADIRDGVQGDHRKCAVAAALKRDGYVGVSVSCDTVYVDGYSFKTSSELATWLREFDHNRRGVHPDRWVLQSVSA